MSFALWVAAADATGDRCTAAPHGGAVDCSADDEQAERREQGQQMTTAVRDVGERVATHRFRPLRGGVVHLCSEQFNIRTLIFTLTSSFGMIKSEDEDWSLDISC